MYIFHAQGDPGDMECGASDTLGELQTYSFHALGDPVA
jgi:hypothetical protein